MSVLSRRGANGNPVYRFDIHLQGRHRDGVFRDLKRPHVGRLTATPKAVDGAIRVREFKARIRDADAINIIPAK